MQRDRENQWIASETNRYLAAYGEVPPPWVFAPNSHPLSIQWRMGGGEGFLMVFNSWFGPTIDNETDRIAYFRKNPPPPRWMEWMVCAIWSLEPWEEEIDFAPYFEKLVNLGFEGVSEFEQDYEDEKWVLLEAGEIE